MDCQVKTRKLFVLRDAQTHGLLDHKENDEAHNAAVDQRGCDREDLDADLRHHRREFGARHGARCKEARQNGADHAADAVYAEGVQRVVITELGFDDGNHPEAEDAGNKTDEKCWGRFNEARSRGNRDQTCNRTGNHAEERGLAAGNPFGRHPGDGAGSRSDLRDKDRHHSTFIRSQTGTTVKAHPAEPEQAGADHRKGEVGRSEVLRTVARAAAEHQAGDETGNTGIDVHDRAAGVVKRTHLEEESVGSPNPVADRGIHEKTPGHHEDAERRKFHAFSERPSDERGSQDGKCHLEEDKEQFRDGPRER